jgi:hypothetical protein
VYNDIIRTDANRTRKINVWRFIGHFGTTRDYLLFNPSINLPTCHPSMNLLAQIPEQFGQNSTSHAEIF